MVNPSHINCTTVRMLFFRNTSASASVSTSMKFFMVSQARNPGMCKEYTSAGYPYRVSATSFNSSNFNKSSLQKLRVCHGRMMV
jgi:hypothetical protein